LNGAVKALQQAQRAMAATGQGSPGQIMGRAWPIGCVALEITQRCNLDCTLCYLSESSQAIRDLPLEEVFRRIDDVRSRYGNGANIQITGGEPTLRPRSELIAIVRHAAAAGLRPALFTNGIRATRNLLEELCDAGLVDVAFHVDTTQKRKGYASEAALNTVREEYIERARGLPLAVYFNTTVHDGNFADVPSMVEFFIRSSDVVSLASFQLQAETGRGILGARSAGVTPDGVMRQIRMGAGIALDFDAVRVGHARCNRYAMALVVNGRAYDALDDAAFVQRCIAEVSALGVDRLDWRRSLSVLARHAMRRPGFLLDSAAWLAHKAWQMKSNLLAGHGRVRKITFFIHNFMDACNLEQERLDACAFAAATTEGPVSMCLHNARRDNELLKPLPMQRGARIGFWNPLTGAIQDHAPSRLVVQHSRKTARGRVRERL
jgi:organic radical activating enzyme